MGEGDLVAITVYGHTDLSGDFKVGNDGTIMFPLIGPFRVRGLPVQQAAVKLEAALERDYLVDAQVGLTVKEYQSQMVIVLGEVVRPGRYYLKNQESTLMDVLSEAGGLSANAGTFATVQRAARGTTPARQEIVRLSALFSGGAAPELLRVRAGDVVNVAKKQFFYVSGEVANPGSYQLEADLTLLKAISLAGGLGKFASRRVEVHRAVEGKKEILKLHLSDIEGKKTDDLAIEPEDLIIVSRRFL